MPHFVLNCSQNIPELVSLSTIMKNFHIKTVSKGLFDEKNIKVRINSFKNYLIYNIEDESIHVFSNIMKGINTSQKKELSESIFKGLNETFPEVLIYNNISEFKKSTFYNKLILK